MKSIYIKCRKALENDFDKEPLYGVRVLKRYYKPNNRDIIVGVFEYCGRKFTVATKKQRGE